MLFKPLCVCLTLSYIPLAKESHLVKPESGWALQSHMPKGVADMGKGVGNWDQFFKLPHLRIMV